MKNFYFKIMSYLILFVCVCIPLLGAAKILCKPNWVNTTTTIEETTVLEKATDFITLYVEFADQLEKVKTKGNLNHTLPPTDTTNIIIENQNNETENINTKQITTTEQSTTPLTTETSYVSSEKYPIAATVWNYLRNLGYNKAICAGILGNMMAEVGGQTLALEPFMYDDGYYGICQWSLYYNPTISDTDLSTQLNYLARTIKDEIDNFGYKYYSGFNYSTFLTITDPGEAAKAFAITYERCASWTYSVRVSNAYTAYDYFT